jgi:hypothetical protein
MQFKTANKINGLNPVSYGLAVESFGSHSSDALEGRGRQPWRIKTSVCGHFSPLSTWTHFGPFRSSSVAFQGSERQRMKIKKQSTNHPSAQRVLKPAWTARAKFLA